MSQPAPGRYFRKGLSLLEITRLFPTDAAAEKWIAETRWPEGPVCPYCGSLNVQSGIAHRTMTHRCRDCPDRKMFSLKTGTVMAGTKLGYQVWAIAIYLLATNLKGVSSMKLHRDVGVTQKTAWHLAHRIRATWTQNGGSLFTGPVEADECYIGGKAKNMHAKVRRVKIKGRGPAGKVAVAGVRDRKTGKVRAAVVKRTDGPTLQGFVDRHKAADAKLYTDETSAYDGMPNRETVNHGVGEYVKGQASINGMESFWAMLKRGYTGVYHRMSPEHLPRYIGEFEGRHNQRPRDTIDQMEAMVLGGEGKRLRYRDLTAHRHNRRARAV